jgi:cytochrome b561
MLRNSSIGYGWVAIVFHWTIAALIIGQWGLGWTMEHLVGPRLAFGLIQWHKSVGLLILALALLRLSWRLANPRPLLPEGMSPFEKLAAGSVHRGLYWLMVLLPLSGWALVSASVLEIPTYTFYLFVMPDLPIERSEAAESFWTTAHIVLGWILVAIVAAHVLAALRHHFLLHDTVLKRMIRPAQPLTKR